MRFAAMFRRTLVLFALLPALVACGGDEQPSVTSVVPVSYTISSAAAGPITPDTPYSTATMRKLFPNERIDVISTADEDGIVNALTVFSDGLQVMMVIPAPGVSCSFSSMMTGGISSAPLRCRTVVPFSGWCRTTPACSTLVRSVPLSA